jgi:hypothetical protein
MDMSRLYGVQYVRVASEAIEPLSRHLGVAITARDELVVTIDRWPAAVRPAPLRALDGRLIAGDPLLLALDPDGLTFAGVDGDPVRVPWEDVHDLQCVRSDGRRSA